MSNDNISRFDKFDDWLKNIFWYYYKWYILAGAAVLTFLILWLFSALSTVEYDWNIVYAHTGQENSETAQKVKSFFKEIAGDVNSNRRTDIQIYEISNMDQAQEKGEFEFYGALYSPDYFLMMVDSATFELYSNLGFFEELDSAKPGMKGVYIEDLDMYAVVNKGPALQYTLEQAEEREVSEEELLEINTALLEEHEMMYERAINIIKNIN